MEEKENEKKESTMDKSMNMALYYAVLLVVGIIIVFFMTKYLRDKFQEYTNEDKTLAYVEYR